jgi:hypothetical protein
MDKNQFSLQLPWMYMNFTLVNILAFPLYANMYKDILNNQSVWFSYRTQLRIVSHLHEVQSDFYYTVHLYHSTIMCNSTETRAILSKPSPMEREAIGLKRIQRRKKVERSAVFLLLQMLKVQTGQEEI